MLDHVAARSRLFQIIQDHIPQGTTVYRSGLQPLAEFPAIVIGMPSWSVDSSSYNTNRTTYPIAVILEKPNTQSPVTVDVLEALWQRIIQALLYESERDGTLAGVCRASAIQHAEFGQFNVQGQDYPAQVIFVDLFA